jgi:hypothetical protein
MNARQKAKSDMCKVVEQVCDENAGILSEIAAFQTAVNKFKTLLAQLLETEQIRSLPLTGITADKSLDRANLCRLSANLAGYIYAYASVAKNETLKAEVNYSHSKLLLMREDQLVAATQNIHALGTTNNGALKDYGVTDAKLTELQTAIDVFKASMPKPRVAKGQKITLTANRDEIFDQIDDILINQMDVLVPNYEETHPDFVHRYREARKIKDPATTKTQLKGKVTNAADNSPINDATITVVELGLSATTNLAGEYQFKPIDYGEFTVKVTATGFQDLEVDEVKIKLGEINSLNLQI